MSESPFPFIEGQRGLATVRQLNRAGWTASAIAHLAATSGRRVFPSVYASHRGPLVRDDRLVAASLWAGPDAVLTGGWALARHGLDLPREPGVTRFLVPPTRRTRSGPYGVVTSRSTVEVRSVVRNDVAVAVVERALADAGRYHEFPSGELEALTLSALQRRLTTPDRLDDTLVLRGPQGVGGVARGLLAFRRGAWSVPEAILADAVAHRRDLPVMLANPVLTTRAGVRIGIPDGYFVEAGVAVQVHSRTYHSGPDGRGRNRWEATVERDQEYQRHGIVVVPVTPATLRDGLSGFLDSLAAVVRQHSGRRPLDVVVA